MALRLLLFISSIIGGAEESVQFFQHKSLLGQSEQELLPGPINRAKLDIRFWPRAAAKHNHRWSKSNQAVAWFNPGTLCSEVHALAHWATASWQQAGAEDGDEIRPSDDTFLSF